MTKPDSTSTRISWNDHYKTILFSFIGISGWILNTVLPQFVNTDWMIGAVVFTTFAMILIGFLPTWLKWPGHRQSFLINGIIAGVYLFYVSFFLTS